MEKGIETNRLIITKFTPDMAEVVHQNSLDENTRRFLSDEVFETVEDAAETIDFLMSQYEGADGPFVYPIITNDGGKNIGYVQLCQIDDGSWEIGYHIAKQFTRLMTKNTKVIKYHIDKNEKLVYKNPSPYNYNYLS